MAHLDITKENFDEFVINIGKPVLLDFWAPWCGPCKMVGPIVEEIASEREDIVVGKVNVDEEIELAKRYKIVSIPTLLLVKGGEVVTRSIGYKPKDEILKMLG